MIYLKKFIKLHGLIVASGSTQDTIILNPESYMNLMYEICEEGEIVGYVTSYGPINIDVDDFGVNLEDVE